MYKKLPVIYRFFSILFVLAALFALIMSITVILRITTNMSTQTIKKIPEYHFSMYIPDTEQSFFSDILAGAKKFSAENNTALSVHKIGLDSLGFLAAPYTGVDGIAVFSFSDNENIVKMLDTVSQKNIPLVLIDHAIATHTPYAFSGINNFELGKGIGSHMLKLKNPQHIAIVYSEKSPGMYAERELIEMGISSVLKEKTIFTLYAFKTSLSMLDAEEVFSQITEAIPKITAIVLTNADDTLAAAKMSIELNLVGSINIIGYGNNATVQDYLNKGVLTATISTDLSNVGYQALNSLYDICKNGYTPSYVYTDFEILTAQSEFAVK